MNTNLKIAFIGAGNMATSLAGGLIAKGLPSHQITLSDPNQERLNELRNEYGVLGTTQNIECIQDAHVIILAVKPQIMADILSEIADTVKQNNALVISIAAGITLTKLSQGLGTETALVRCMPNTPALVQCGATGLISNAAVNAAQREIAQSILESVGIALWMEHEEQIDAVTAVSGSGPAYFFLVMESMIQAGIDMGLSQQQAQQLTLQTALGAATMAMDSDVAPKELRKRVTSPGGTTEQAVNYLQDGDLPKLFKEALQAAKIRSEELGK
ncbi:MAG: pyrroline-5-carboxylate reductase [Gammaproteobacteria bacterium]|nr:MAG: pyrroline-5-carboxylate reductase [Gammaproteobacteria bacterium]